MLRLGLAHAVFGMEEPGSIEGGVCRCGSVVKPGVGYGNPEPVDAGNSLANGSAPPAGAFTELGVVDVVASSGLDIFERGHTAARVLVVDDEAREDLRLADLPHVVKMQGLRSRRGMGRIFLKGRSVVTEGIFEEHPFRKHDVEGIRFDEGRHVVEKRGLHERDERTGSVGQQFLLTDCPVAGHGVDITRYARRLLLHVASPCSGIACCSFFVHGLLLVPPRCRSRAQVRA